MLSKGAPTGSASEDGDVEGELGNLLDEMEFENNEGCVLEGGEESFLAAEEESELVNLE